MDFLGRCGEEILRKIRKKCEDALTFFLKNAKIYEVKKQKGRAFGGGQLIFAEAFGEKNEG